MNAMKNLPALIILTLFAAPPATLFGQAKTDSAAISLKSWDISLYLGRTEAFTSGVSWEGYFSNKLIAGFDINTAGFEALKTPPDFLGGLDMILEGTPKDNISSYTLLFGTFVPLGPKGKSRLIVDGGPGYKVYRETNFTPHHESGWFDLSSNYDRTYIYYNTVGFMARTRLEWLFSRHMGVGIGGTLNLSEYAVLPSYEISLLFGKVRK